MATKLNFTSKVRAGMAVERASAGERLADGDVVGIAQRDAGAAPAPAEQAAGPTAPQVAPQPEIAAVIETVATHAVTRISVDDVVSNPYNPRAFYSAETIDELAESFASQGQITPILVTRLPQFPGKYVIVDGERRIRAARSRGDKLIDADVRDGLDNQNLYLRAYHANKEREEQTVFDDALAWKKLLDDGVYVDQTELGVAVGEDPKHISKVISLTSLPPYLLQRMAQNRQDIGLGHAYNIKLIFDRAGASVAEHWLEQVIEGKASVRKLEAAASAEAGARRVGPRRTHYQSRVQFSRPDGVALGELKLFGDGRAELNLKGIAAADQQRLAERMKAVIDEWASEMEPVAVG
ncbi:ParB/RepB/Spo0J family partition protein [Paraburkholderia tropica]|uniref:Chromosome partitioning protein, ParB family n=1 Tax=Paraburkholderia tropica TaxID=92647 RepID=A0AAQ1JYB2_9BURK|nr:ParB/RepB/Spo0J family partition protein [Paraburkholderia tropica]RQN34223.1 ParB/RepB/Spo0J family partition protein [Paraburkholderia tropica]SEK14748.1 chromosome partitioning protein, ParB family [Paraburkholderia tropica]